MVANSELNCIKSGLNFNKWVPSYDKSGINGNKFIINLY